MSPSAVGRLEAAGRSDTGLARKKNEDHLLHRPDAGLLAVADGMGGAPAGEVASALAVEALEEGLDAGTSPSEEAMVAAFQAAHRRILQEQEARPERRGMGTTLTAVHVDPVSGRFVLGHRGDSRAYRFGGSGFELLTRDHTWVDEEVAQGRLSPAQARGHPYRHVLTRVVGVGDEGRPDVVEGRFEAGEVIVLCSDGLLAIVGEADVERHLVALGSEGEVDALQGAVDELVEAAHQGGSPDNVTVVLGRWLSIS